jgi:DNA-binding transcriptional LysR family regulator
LPGDHPSAKCRIPARPFGRCPGPTAVEILVSTTGNTREAALQPLGERDLRQTPLSANGSALEFRELRYFTVLCEELHFGRAAERLHISQSPLSQAIAQLERKLGTRLLDRSSRHVHLTPAGQVLLEHGRRLLREADAAVGATKRAAAGETGVLRFAAGPVPRAAILPALRYELDRRFPTLMVEIADDIGESIVESVLYGASDVGVMLCAPSHPEIEAKLMRRDATMAVMGREHPLARRKSVTVADLAGYTLVLWPRELAEAAHDVVLSIFQRHEPASLRVAGMYGAAFYEAMQAGGFAVVPLSAAVSRDFATVPIVDAGGEFTMSMLWSRHTPPAILGGLIEAADAAIANNNWL